MLGRWGLAAGSSSHPGPTLAPGERHQRLLWTHKPAGPRPAHHTAAAGSAGCSAAAPAVAAPRRSLGSALAGADGVPRCVPRAARQPVRRPPLRLQTKPSEAGADDGGQAAAEPEETEVAALVPGVVRVQCVQDLPRFDLPLLLGNFRSSSCNAVAITYCGQPYLLTSAANVAYGSQIRVLLPGRDKPFSARLLHLGLDCELAALAVEQPEFWDQLVPYELASYGLPHLQQPVSVVSYAEGQPRPRTAPGTVMRTEVVTYPSALQRLLGLTVAVVLGKDQLGSAVVDSRGRCLGLVFARTAGSGGSKAGAGDGMGGSGGGGASGGDQRWGQGRRRVGRRRGRRGQTEAAATVVPVPVVTHFLEDIRSHGRYLGFPTLGIQWKRTESAALRHYTGMAPSQTGVAIVSINPTAALAAHAQPLDVLSAVGAAAVDNDGTVAFRDGTESINLSYHISQFQVGDAVELTLIRNGQQYTAPLTLDVPHRLLPLHLNGRPPQYLVVSGLVMTVLSGPFLEGAFGRGWAVRAPVQLLREWHNQPTTEDEQVVVVAECQDLGPDSGTDGYERRAAMHQRVVRCNGVPVRNLRHLVLMVAEAMTAADAATKPTAAATGKRRGAAAGLPAAGADGAADPAVAALAGDEAAVPGSGEAADHPDEQLPEAASSSDGTDIAAASPLPDSDGSTSTSAVVVVAAGDEDRSVGRGPPRDVQDLILELSNRMLMVLPLRQAREDTRAMLAEYEVQHAVSEDLRPAYEGALRLGRGSGSGAGAVGGKGVGAAGSRGRGAAGRTRAAVMDGGGDSGGR